MKRFLLPVVLALACVGNASARNRFVPAQYATIQAAVDAADPGDVVMIASGLYNDCIHLANPPSDSTLCVVVLKSGVTLRGEGGTGGVLIDAGTNGRGIHCDGVINAVIEGITVAGAFAPNYGAGIYCYNGSSPQIRDCVVRNCLDGGIIIRKNSNPTLTNVIVRNNAAKEGGGLAIDDHSNPIITSCFILGNEAPSGGGIYIRAASAPQITNCIVNDNKINLDNGAGAGITVDASNPVITDCLIQNNGPRTTPLPVVFNGPGGGISISEAVMTLSRCTITGNRTTATYGPGGGVLVGYNANVTIEDCLIAGNSVAGADFWSDGGGIRAFGALALTIRRCTIAANSAAGGLGGGISTNGTFPVLERTIISHSSSGGALYCDDAEFGSFNVTCCDLYGNAGGNTICGTDGGNNFSLDPLFCNLATGQYYLQPTSPCLAGHHPNGPTACGGGQIGVYGGGCAPLDVPEADARFALSTRPNPFRGSTEIRFALPAAARVGVAIYDAAGREVRVLADGPMSSGPHSLVWDGADASGRPASSGVYFYRLTVDGRAEGNRVIVAR